MRFPFENRCSRALSYQMVHLINDFNEGMAHRGQNRCCTLTLEIV